MGENKEKIQYVVLGIGLALYAAIACYKLTNSSLWYDETVEYWYSKIMAGPIPFIERGNNMYERIISTYQPPLYNFIMYFWLLISSSQWWFRFFGVVCGFIGMIGLYKVLRLVCDTNTAICSVFFSSFVVKLVYYWQECAEYCIMLASLFWTVYTFARVIENKSKKNIILFNIAVIIPVYSQYGAAFVITPLIVIVAIDIILTREQKTIKTLVISYLCSFIFAAVPLYLFFLKRQLLLQKGGTIALKNINTHFIKDFGGAFITVAKFSFFENFSDEIIKCILFIFLLAVVLTFVFSSRKIIKYLIISNAVTFLIYYFVVKTEIYAYGQFGVRWNLFFIPAWIILIAAVVFELLQIFKNIFFQKKYLNNLYYICAGGCFAAIFCYGVIAWESSLKNNWTKDNIRGVTECWYNNQGFLSDTIVWYAADFGFSYYLQQNKQYDSSFENRIKYFDYFYNDDAAWDTYMNTMFENEIPEEMYFVAYFFDEDRLSVFLNYLANQQYNVAEKYNQNGSRLYYISK